MDHFRPVIVGGLLFLGEVGLLNTAKWAGPVERKFLKRSARGNAIVRIAYFGIIHITANAANIFFHNNDYLRVNNRGFEFYVNILQAPIMKFLNLISIQTFDIHKDTIITAVL